MPNDHIEDLRHADRNVRARAALSLGTASDGSVVDAVEPVLQKPIGS